MPPVSEEMERAVLRGCLAFCYCSNDFLGSFSRCDFITAKLHHKCSIWSYVFPMLHRSMIFQLQRNLLTGTQRILCRTTQSMTRFLTGSAAGLCLGCLFLYIAFLIDNFQFLLQGTRQIRNFPKAPQVYLQTVSLATITGCRLSSTISQTFSLPSHAELAWKIL